MPKKVCVVDDQPSLRQMLRFALDQQGYDICEAANGVEALQLLASEPVDVLLVDWQMPVMNGIELVRILRDKPEYDALPIIMVSCRDDISVRKEAYSLGVNSWLKKPFRMSQILAVVNNALETMPAQPDNQAGNMAAGSF